MTTDCIFENVNILFQNRRPFESVWVETSIFCGKIILFRVSKSKSEFHSSPKSDFENDPPLYLS